MSAVSEAMPKSRKRPPPRDPAATVDPHKLPDQYAMQAVGRCMEPLIADGTVLVFDRTAPCRPGDTVAIFRTPEARWPEGQPDAIVKRLVQPFGDDPTERSNVAPLLVVEMLNPRRRLYLSRSDVAAVHRCIGPAIVQPDGRCLVGRDKLGGADQ